jgi:methane monooxygenase component D
MTSRQFNFDTADDLSEDALGHLGEDGLAKDYGSASRIEIHSQGRYQAFTQDVECMWRWEIHMDGEVVQVGCSLSESSSREAVAHVIAYFQRRDAPRPVEPASPDA